MYLSGERIRAVIPNGGCHGTQGCYEMVPRVPQTIGFARIPGQTGGDLLIKSASS